MRKIVLMVVTISMIAGLVPMTCGMDSATSEPLTRAYTVRGPISIDGDMAFTSLNGVVNPGAAGSEVDPYIVEGWEIDGTGLEYCIRIQGVSSNVHYVVRNCYIHNASGNWNSAGIKVVYSESGSFEDNIISTNDKGLLIDHCRNLVIDDNNFEFCSIVFVTDWYDMTADYFDSHTITPYNVVDSMPIKYITGGDQKGKVFTHPGGQVIVANCSNLVITDAELNAGDVGIFLVMSSNVTIEESEFTHNDIGLQLYYSSNNVIRSSNFRDNFEGINISHNSYNNQVMDCNCSYNTDCGIKFTANQGSHNLIKGNDLYYNDIGFYSWASGHLEIAGNIIDGNRHGIELWGSEWNVVRKNLVRDSSGYGVRVWGWSPLYNHFYHNSFLHNNRGGVQAEDTSYDMDSSGYWNDTDGLGNYWSDYKDRYADQAPSNDRTRWNIPYDLAGGARVQDLYPLVNQMLASNGEPPEEIVVGSGGDFWNLQEAIDAAEPGSMIIVRPGTYYGPFYVNKTLELAGTSSDNTLLDGRGFGHCLTFNGDGCSITGFNFTGIGTNQSGVLMLSSDNTVANCTFHNLFNGVHVLGGNYNDVRDCHGWHCTDIVKIENSRGSTIEGCIARVVQGSGFVCVKSLQCSISKCLFYGNSGNWAGVDISMCTESTIYKNTFNGGNNGICSLDCVDLFINNNTVVGSGTGILLWFEQNSDVLITYNHIESCEYAVINDGSSNVDIHHNVFLNNPKKGTNTVVDSGDAQWDDWVAEGNYWSDYITRYPEASHNGKYWDTPYAIGGNSDRYPLVADPLQRFELPRITIDYPIEGQDLSGKVDIFGNASSPLGITLVEVRIGDGSWVIVVGTEQWAYYLDTTYLENGQVTIQARSFNGMAHSMIATRNVTVNNEFFNPSPTLNELISPNTNGSYRISWSVVGLATSYLLQECVDLSLGEWDTIYDGSLTFFEVTDKMNGTYWYRVRAENGSEYSAWSNVVHISVSRDISSLPRMGPPTLDISPSPDADGDYQVTVGEVMGAATYKIEESTEENGSYYEVYSGPNRNFYVYEKPSGTYWYRAMAVGPGYQLSLPSEPVFIIVELDASHEPEEIPVFLNLNMTVYADSYTIRWTQVGDYQDYKLSESSDPSGENPDETYKVRGTNLDVEVSSDRTIYYRVRWVDGDEHGPWSAVGWLEFRLEEVSTRVQIISPMDGSVLSDTVSIIVEVEDIEYLPLDTGSAEDEYFILIWIKNSSYSLTDEDDAPVYWDLLLDTGAVVDLDTTSLENGEYSIHASLRRYEWNGRWFIETAWYDSISVSIDNYEIPVPDDDDDSEPSAEGGNGSEDDDDDDDDQGTDTSSVSGGMSKSVASAVAILVVLSISMIFIFGTEVGAYGFYYSISGLTRKKNVLDNQTRGMLLGYIKSNPGDHYSSIKQVLKLPNGSLAYHLHILEKEDFIKSRTSGVLKRFYPTGTKSALTEMDFLTPKQMTILDIIMKHDGATQAEISKLSDISQPHISALLKLLQGRAFVKVDRSGTVHRYHAVTRKERYKRDRCPTCGEPFERELLPARCESCGENIPLFNRDNLEQLRKKAEKGDRFRDMRVERF